MCGPIRLYEPPVRTANPTRVHRPICRLHDCLFISSLISAISNTRPCIDMLYSRRRLCCAAPRAPSCMEEHRAEVGLHPAAFESRRASRCVACWPPRLNVELHMTPFGLRYGRTRTVTCSQALFYRSITIAIFWQSWKNETVKRFDCAAKRNNQGSNRRGGIRTGSIDDLYFVCALTQKH